MTAQSTAEWVKDLYMAADELGYFVESVDMRGGLVISDKRTPSVTIELRGIFISGPYLRSILQPTARREATA